MLVTNSFEENQFSFLLGEDIKSIPAVDFTYYLQEGIANLTLKGGINIPESGLEALAQVSKF